MKTKGKIISRDGTEIVFEKMGSGPAIILVDGAFCSKDFGPMPKLAPLLSKSFTVFIYDRRARGESGDTMPYKIEKEIEDIEALIKSAGGSAFLFGISSGAILSIQAVASGLNVPKLAILEPPYVGNQGGKRPGDAVQQLRNMIAEGRKEDAVKFYLTKVMGAPGIVLFILRLTPNWSKMKANANSLPYDVEVCGNFEMPKEMISSLTTPTLVIDSKGSPETLRKSVELVANTLPNGKRKSLKGSVHDVPPKILAPELIHFFMN